MISLQLRLAGKVYGQYQAPMLANGLGMLYNFHRQLISSPWFVRFAWWGIVARSWWLLADHHHKFYKGANALWVYTLPFTVLKALVRSGLRMLQRSLEGMLAAYGRTLAYSTSICARLGLLGDLVLIPVTLIWMGWPLYLPYS